MTAHLALWLTLLTLVSGPAYAQLIEGPQGAVGGLFGGRRPVDPNRTSQTFDVTFDLTGGYDTNPIGFASEATPNQPDLTRWYASTGTTAARYRIGSIRRSLEARGSGFFNYQSNATETIYGGDGTVSAVARFGRRRVNQLTAEFQSAYEPGWIFGAFGPSLGPGPDDPSVGGVAPQGVVEQRWLALAGSAGYQHHWNRRQFTTTRYEKRHVRPMEGDGLDADWQTVLFDHSWAARPGLNVVGGYRWDESRQRDEELEIPPARYQTFDAGLNIERRSSQSRRYSLTVRGGATRLMQAPATSQADSLHPSLTANAEFATSRFWGLSAELSRAVTVLSGVSPVPVLNDNAGVTFSGTPSRKLRYFLFASLSRGRTLTVDPSLENLTDVAGVSGSLRYAIANWSAILVSYGFYHHRIEDPSLIVSGFPPEYDRHSFRVGMTFWVPMYGAF